MNGKKQKKRIILSSLLCVFMLFGVCACQITEPEEITSGGTTDRTDPNAPKEISSKEISSFYTTFYLIEEWEQGFKGGQFTFEIKQDETGVLTAYASSGNLSAPADDALLHALQETIDEHELVKQNGIWRVTAGLAPEYQKCSLTADYESGEQLSFTTNNDPYALWIKQIYLNFAEWFAEQGEESLLP